MVGSSGGGDEHTRQRAAWSLETGGRMIAPPLLRPVGALGCVGSVPGATASLAMLALPLPPGWYVNCPVGATGMGMDMLGSSGGGMRDTKGTSIVHQPRNTTCSPVALREEAEKAELDVEVGVARRPSMLSPRDIHPAVEPAPLGRRTAWPFAVLIHRPWLPSPESAPPTPQETSPSVQFFP